MRLAISVLVRSSQLLKCYLLLLLGLTCFALLFAAVMLYGKFGFYSPLMFVVSLLLVLRLIHLQFSRLTSYRLEIDNEGRMVLRDIDLISQDESVQLVHVNSPIVLWSHFILLHVHDASGMQRCLLIFRDAVSADAFRQLRVMLTCLTQRRQHALLDVNQMTEGNF